MNARPRRVERGLNRVAELEPHRLRFRRECVVTIDKTFLRPTSADMHLTDDRAPRHEVDADLAEDRRRNAEPALSRLAVGDSTSCVMDVGLIATIPSPTRTSLRSFRPSRDSSAGKRSSYRWKYLCVRTIPTALAFHNHDRMIVGRNSACRVDRSVLGSIHFVITIRDQLKGNSVFHAHSPCQRGIHFHPLCVYDITSTVLICTVCDGYNQE